jgi:hypothetical protein
MSQPVAHTRSRKDYWNQKTITIDTGAALDAMLAYLPGQLVYCTADGGTHFAFKNNHLYERKADNSGWIEYAINGLTQTLTNKSLDGGTVTFSNLPVTAVINNAVTAGKITGYPLSKIAIFSSASSFNTSSLSYVDITSVTLTLNCQGNRSALISEFISSVQSGVALHGEFFRIVDSGATTTYATATVSNLRTNLDTGVDYRAFEAAPAAGNVTRKVQMVTSGGDSTTVNAGLLTKGLHFYMWEVI